MKVYRSISMSFWTDSKVDDDFTPEEKYFFLYLMTNPHTNICGCYEISVKQMERETGYNTDTVMRLLARMQDTHNVIKYDSETKEVLIVNWHKYNWTKSEKLVKAVLSVAKRIKSDDFRKYVMNTVCIRYGYGIDTSDTDTVSDTDTETVTETESDISVSDNIAAAPPQPKRTRFTPPTVEEVAEYCKERGNKVDPQQFVDFYASKGWKVGNSPMKDWKAAIRSTWERQERQQSRAAPAKRNANKGCYSSIDDAVFEKIMNPYGVSSIDESDVEKIMNPYGIGGGS